MAEHFYSHDFLVGARQPCPWCGHPLDAIGQANSPECEQPEPGDATVCIQCANVCLFAAGLVLRRAEPHEIDDVARQVQADIRRLHHRLP